MAFPTVPARGSARTTASNTTTHAITLPAHQAGDRLVVHLASDGAATTSVNTGSSSADWEKLGQASNGTVVSGSIFTKVAASASETLTITTSAGEQSSHTVLVVRPATAGYTTAIYGAASDGSSTNSNPPNLAPAPGAQDYLWIVTRAGDSTVVATVAPADFADLQTQAAAGTGGASSNTAERSLNAASLDPGTFTSASEQWVSWTLAVYEFLAAVDLTGSGDNQGSTASSGAISQTHILTGADSAQPASSLAGAITQTHVLVGPVGQVTVLIDGLPLEVDGQPVQVTAAVSDMQAATATAGAIEQGSAEVTLTGQSVNQPTTSTAGAVVQAHVLAGADSVHGATVTAGAVSQVHVLVGQGAAQGATATSGAISQTHILDGAGSVQPTTSTAGAISETQPVVLTGQSVNQPATSSAGAVGQTHVLAAVGAVQPATANADAISQTHVLAAQSVNQPTTSTAGAISETAQITLTGQSVSQPATSSAGAIGQTHILAGLSAVGASTASAGAVQQIHVLAGADSVQPATSTAGAITELPVVNLAGGDCVQVATSTAGAIGQTHVLGATGALGMLQATAGAIGQIHILAGGDCVQSTTSSAGGTMKSAPSGPGFTRISTGARPGMSGSSRSAMTNTRR